MTGIYLHVSLCMPTILSNRETIKEGFTGQNEDDPNSSHMAIATTVSKPTFAKLNWLSKASYTLSSEQKN